MEVTGGDFTGGPSIPRLDLVCNFSIFGNSLSHLKGAEDSGR